MLFQKVDYFKYYHKEKAEVTSILFTGTVNGKEKVCLILNVALSLI